MRGRLRDVTEHCLEEFRNHWLCLDSNNHQMWDCRVPERKLNKCVFDNLVRSSVPKSKGRAADLCPKKLEKTIPDSPKGETPVHLRKRQLYGGSMSN